ncbi:hypothetical protein [Nocardia asiatica]|uniref:hypothetical protein n=1 Tax=Nocardia asiatica TaxID=209252 RepID=UPI002453901D|nr:hypothetical protein [Nocardia asiatica]
MPLMIRWVAQRADAVFVGEVGRARVARESALPEKSQIGGVESGKLSAKIYLPNDAETMHSRDFGARLFWSEDAPERRSRTKRVNAAAAFSTEPPPARIRT